MNNDAKQFAHPVCEQLPADARSMLVRAAATPIPDADPLARKRAIDRANKTIRRMYPALFKPEIADEIAIHRIINKE